MIYDKPYIRLFVKPVYIDTSALTRRKNSLPGIPDSRGSQTPVWDLDRTGAAVERISCFISIYIR